MIEGDYIVSFAIQTLDRLGIRQRINSSGRILKISVIMRYVLRLDALGVRICRTWSGLNYLNKTRLSLI